MRISRYILTIFVVLTALTACQKEDSSSAIGKGKGRVVLGGIDIDVEATTRAYSVPAPSINDLTIEIIDPDNFVIESGHIDHYANGIDLFVATYTLRAYYGNKQQMGDSPYFEGTATFSIHEGETTKLGTVIANLANAIIIPHIPTDIIDHFIGVPTFNISYGEQKQAVTNGQSLYVLPGTYTLTLEGTNKAGVDIKKTITELDAIAQKVYNINCDLALPVLTLPEQQAGAWAKRLYIQAVNATDKNGKSINVPEGITYEIKSSNISDWSTAESIKDNSEKIVFTGLNPNTSYTVRARLADVVFSNEVTITTESIVTIPNGNLDEYSIVKGEDGASNTSYGAVYEFYSDKDSSKSWWRTNNDTKCSKASTGLWGYCFSWTSRSGTRPDSDTKSKTGSSARIMTSGYGTNNTLLTPPSSPKSSAIGRLYTDKINCNSRPTTLEFYYKYSPKDSDSPIIKITIYNENTIIGSAQLSSASYYTEYQNERTRLDIKYNEFQTKATHIEIIFESGTNTNVSKIHDDKNGVMPMFVGSQLYIDEVELIYE